MSAPDRSLSGQLAELTSLFLAAGLMVLALEQSSCKSLQLCVGGGGCLEHARAGCGQPGTPLGTEFKGGNKNLNTETYFSHLF